MLAAAVLTAVALGACQPDPDPEAQRTERAAADERKAEAMAADFDAAIAAENWPLARAQGEVLMADFPDSAAAARIEAKHQEAKAKAETATEARRTAALWTYQTQRVDDGLQLSAAIQSKDRVDVGDGPAQSVRLIFRDHPDWGKSSYLVLQNGDFDCYGGCNVQVTVDDAAPRAMEASRPDTDEAIAMFIEDERALWNLAKDAGRISIDIPVKAGGTRTVVYEVAGLDETKLPDWN
ncbi:MAG: hypothetical protein M3Q40_05265 [Pseudomonadota bacterium]|nr:hypothetical protein [Pseudomonadota bacterium]